jgi:predicted AAA+ superfamily ATPase
MAQKLPWAPWHSVVTLREDVRTGALSLADFAADLHDVIMQKGARPIYEDPARFFALTYPTFSLRELARDVVLRLAGRNTKAIRQLELTYGGGKTHTLVTLRHLVHDPASLPSLPAVQQFKSHIGGPCPKACVVALSFDKLDVEKGMEVRGPKGEMRWLKHPWSVLAFQIGGSDGLRALHGDGKDEERETPPAEPLLVDLLSWPQAEGLSTLVLIDEVLMYAREKVGMAEVWRGRLIDFFQYLCQAVTKVDRCAMVVSLLASDPEKSDPFGKELIGQIFEIFNRQKEEGVQPVQKEDVAEVLRRRFFETASITDVESFRPHVTTAVANWNPPPYKIWSTSFRRS